MTHSLPLGPAISGAIAFVPKALARAPGAIVLFAAAMGLGGYAVRLGLGPWGRAATIALVAASGLVIQGALYRVGVSDSAKGARDLGLGLLGLQFEGAELRLLAAMIQVSLFEALIAASLALVLVFTAQGLGVHVDVFAFDLTAAEPWRVQVIFGLCVLAAWIMIQLGVRLELYKAATVARRRTVSISALGLSEHNFWRLLCGVVVTSLPTIALAVWLCCAGAAGVWRGAVAAVVIAVVQTPLSIGFLSEAYKRLEYWRQHPGEG